MNGRHNLNETHNLNERHSLSDIHFIKGIHNLKEVYELNVIYSLNETCCLSEEHQTKSKWYMYPQWDNVHSLNEMHYQYKRDSLNTIGNLRETHNLIKRHNLGHSPQRQNTLSRSFFLCKNHALKFAKSFRQFSFHFYQEFKIKIQPLSRSFLEAFIKVTILYMFSLVIGNCGNSVIIN